MLKSLWIILNNGLCIYHANFIPESKQKASEDLFSGFVAALFSLSSSMNGEQIQSVTMKGSKLHYLVGSGGTIFSASVEKKAKDSEIKNLLTSIEAAYKQRFSDEDNLMDTDDPRFSLLDQDISDIVSQKITAVRSPRGKKLEEALRQALQGRASIEETVQLVDSEITKGLSKKDEKIIKDLLNELASLSANLNLKSDVRDRLEELREKLATWVDKAKIAVTQGW